MDRRAFLRFVGLSGTTWALSPSAAFPAVVSDDPAGGAYGCLVDLTVCVGCRKCEQACNQVNGLPEPAIPFDDPRVLDEKRRPDVGAYTVVNRWYPGRVDERNQLVPTFVKVQCMHCLEPACVSACIVGALTKKDYGPVHYDASKCIGCRYCLVACPFQIPAYEYHEALAPQVRKCTFCFDRIVKDGGKPGCAAACPVEAIRFGPRARLLELAHEKIRRDPGRYVDAIYGEFEAGGTSWMYLSGVPFEKVGFQKVPAKPMPKLTETIQHGIFSYMWAPASLYAVLAGFMWVNHRKERNGGE